MANSELHTEMEEKFARGLSEEKVREELLSAKTWALEDINGALAVHKLRTKVWQPGMQMPEPPPPPRVPWYLRPLPTLLILLVAATALGYTKREELPALYHALQASMYIGNEFTKNYNFTTIGLIPAFTPPDPTTGRTQVVGVAVTTPGAKAPAPIKTISITPTPVVPPTPTPTPDPVPAPVPDPVPAPEPNPAPVPEPDPGPEPDPIPDPIPDPVPPPPDPTPDPNPAPAPTGTVTTLAELNVALASAVGGETITLAPGNYGYLYISKKNFPSTVTITSADPSNPAVFNNITFYSSSRITVKNVKVDYTPTASTVSYTPIVYINTSTNISFTDSSINSAGAVNGISPSASTLDSTGNVMGVPTGYGFSLARSSNILIQDNEIYNVGKGVAMSSSNYVTIRRNDIHDMRTSPIVGAVYAGLVIDANTLSSSHPWHWGSGDHGDFIHLFNDTNDTSPMTGVTITRNIINQGSGEAILGINLQDKTSTGIGYPNANISNNVILNGDSQGMRLDNIKNSTISNNVLLQTSGKPPSVLLRTGRQPYAQAMGGNRNTLSGNYWHVLDDVSTNVTCGSCGSPDPTNVLSNNTNVQMTNPSASNYYTSSLVSTVSNMSSASAIYSYVQGHITYDNRARMLAEEQQRSQLLAGLGAISDSVREISKQSFEKVTLIILGILQTVRDIL